MGHTNPSWQLLSWLGLIFHLHTDFKPTSWLSCSPCSWYFPWDWYSQAHFPQCPSGWSKRLGEGWHWVTVTCLGTFKTSVLGLTSRHFSIYWLSMIQSLQEDRCQAWRAAFESVPENYITSFFCLFLRAGGSVVLDLPLQTVQRQAHQGALFYTFRVTCLMHMSGFISLNWERTTEKAQYKLNWGKHSGPQFPDEYTWCILHYAHAAKNVTAPLMKSQLLLVAFCPVQ